MLQVYTSISKIELDAILGRVRQPAQVTRGLSEFILVSYANSETRLSNSYVLIRLYLKELLW